MCVYNEATEAHLGHKNVFMKLKSVRSRIQFALPKFQEIVFNERLYGK